MKNKVAYIFDFDDTLIKTTAKIIVRNKVDKSVIKVLSTKEFNNQEYQLKDNEYYDFDEFYDLDILIKETPTITFGIFAEMEYAGYPIFIITSSQKPEDIKEYLKYKKIFLPSENIICTNDKNRNYSGTDANRKLEAIIDIANQGYNVFHIWEDSEAFQDSMNMIMDKAVNYQIFFHKVVE